MANVITGGTVSKVWSAEMLRKLSKPTMLEAMARDAAIARGEPWPPVSRVVRVGRWTVKRRA